MNISHKNAQSVTLKRRKKVRIVQHKLYNCFQSLKTKMFVQRIRRNNYETVRKTNNKETLKKKRTSITQKTRK